MPRSTYWSGRSFAFPLFKRLGLHPDGETDDTVVQSISCSNTAPTDAANPYVDGSLHVTGGSSPGLWLRKAGAWVAAAVQSAAASFTTVTATTAVSTDTVSERTSAAGVTVDGVLLKDSQVTTDVILEKTSATGVTIDGTLVKDGGVVTADAGSLTTNTIAEKTAASGVTVDGCLIKDGRAAALATGAMFLSNEITGTGSSQNTAHGLGAAPTIAFAVLTQHAGASTLVYGSHDGTNCVFTVTSGDKYRIIAFK